MTRHRRRTFVIGRGPFAIPLKWYLLFVAALVGLRAVADIARELYLFFFP